MAYRIAINYHTSPRRSECIFFQASELNWDEENTRGQGLRMENLMCRKGKAWWEKTRRRRSEINVESLGNETWSVPGGLKVQDLKMHVAVGGIVRVGNTRIYTFARSETRKNAFLLTPYLATWKPVGVAEGSNS